LFPLRWGEGWWAWSSGPARFPPGGVVEDPATRPQPPPSGGYPRALALVDVPARVTILQGEDIGRPSRLLVDLAAGERARPGIRHRGPDSRLNRAR
jgi:predicted PhzF superfamily epimerase YddE/YHI9